MLDADLARLYGVSTKAFNQAVRRNRSRFPGDFLFELANQDVARSRSQSVTLNSGRIERQIHANGFYRTRGHHGSLARALSRS
jgi:hypothetical protein